MRVLVNGAGGRMGKTALQTIKETPSLELAGESHRTDNLKDKIQSLNPDIVIDVTTAECVFENTKTIIESGVHPVIGTSGLLPEQVDELTQLSEQKELGGVIVPNFSLGAILMIQFSKLAAQYLDHVEIVELHHDKKLDAPSGTAIKTAEQIQKTKKQSTLPDCKEILSGARGANFENIPIHSIRLPGLLAHQQVIFGNRGETLTLKHDSLDRDCFIPGIRLACEKVSGLKTLEYGLDSLL